MQPQTPRDPLLPDSISRRKMMLQVAPAAAIATAGIVSLARGQQSPPSDTKSQNTSPEKPPQDPLPQNEPLKGENGASWQPPSTDAGDVDSFKYPFNFAHNRVSAGGWARQVTARDLKISTTIAGVNMRLYKGAIRELHWHAAAEWSLMLYGNARITGVDSNGKSFVNDVGPGDLWNFPSGVPHSIQGLEPDGCEFLLVFDDGNFSEFDTFLITDWMAHTPREVLAKNFTVSESAFDHIPKHELYIFNAPLPDSLQQDRQEATGPQGVVDTPFSFRLLQQKPDNQDKGGEVRIVDSHKFPAASTIAAAHVIVHPGGLRELHWHPNADEWQYYVSGKGRMTVFTGGGKARTMDFQAGDVGYIQVSLPHYIENTGDEDLVFLEMFKSSFYQDISLGLWLSHLPPELVQAHLHLPPEMLAGISKEKLVVVPV